MWALAVWTKDGRSDALLFQNEDGTAMIFPSCGEAVDFAATEIGSRSFRPIILSAWL